MNFKYFFVPQGTSITEDQNHFIAKFKLKDEFKELKFSKVNSLFLDTGNILKPGAIDHHQVGSEFKQMCVASIIINHAERFLNHLIDQDEVTIITHYCPDLDAIASVYFAQKYLRRAEFNSSDKIISEYVNMVDLGRLVLNPESPIEIASLWLSFTHDAGSDTQNEETNLDLIAKGLNFMGLVGDKVKQEGNPWRLTNWDQHENLQDRINRINEDAKKYQSEIKSSITGIVHLYNEKQRGIERVEVLISTNTDCFLWKYWARGDKKNSLYEKGFALTCLHDTTQKKSIISIDPNTPFNLCGLGIYLDRLEIEGLLSQNNTLDTLIQTPRSGFHRQNPWYDGRGGHNFTIIDVPNGGTILSHAEINQAIFAYHLWNSYGNLYIESTKEINTLTELEVEKGKEEKLQFFIDKSESNQSIHEQIDEYNTNLAKFKIGQFLALPKHQPYEEENGTLIEKLIKEPHDDIFIHKERILDSVKMAFCTSYSEPEHNTKINHWLKSLANYISKGFEFFESDIYDRKKNELIESLYAYITPQFSYILIEQCEEIPAKSFALLFDKTEAKFEITELFYKLLTYQTKHRSGFLPNNVDEFIKEKESISTDSKSFITQMMDDSWDIDFHEEIPIYAYNSIKNYFDDLFHLMLDEKNLVDHKLVIEAFKKSDFKKIALSNLCGENLALFDKVVNTEKDLKSHLFNSLYGKNFETLKNSKYDIIKSLTEQEVNDKNRAKRDLLIKYLIELDFERLRKANFNKSRKTVRNIERHNYLLENNIPAISPDFIDHLRTFEEVGSMEMLFIRIKRFLILGEINNRMEEDNFIILWNNLLYSLFRVITLYTNFNDIDEIEEEIEKSIGLINELRLIPSNQDNLNTHELREKFASFLPVLLDELNLPVQDLDLQIESSIKQYETISGLNGILKLSENLPNFYKVRVHDLFLGFKRYYKERLEFLRTDIKHLIEESQSGEEKELTIKYVRVCNNLINESVSFDWQELKDRVDDLEPNEKNERYRSLFYEKYFYWLSKNMQDYEEEAKEILNKLRQEPSDESEDDSAAFKFSKALNEAKEELYQLNSQIRFAEGNGNKSLYDIIDHLPNKPTESSQKVAVNLESLTRDFQLKHIIRHKPIKLIHGAYDFLIEYFIAKFHVDNVKESLSRFSTKFPWYYSFFTNLKNLRTIFISLIILMFVKGVFDNRPDIISNKESAAYCVQEIFGKNIFCYISSGLDYIWICIIGITFIVPFVFLIKLIFNWFKKKTSKSLEKSSISTHHKLNFFDLIYNIEGKRNHLLYIPYVIPLIIVVLQIANKDTFDLITNIEEIRYLTTLVLLIGLTYISVYNYVKDKNKNMSESWLKQRTQFMLWLHLCQAFFIAIFTVDLIIQYAISKDSFFLGIPNVINIHLFGGDKDPWNFHVALMPSFTLMATFLSLFFSFFIERLFGGGKN